MRESGRDQTAGLDLTGTAGSFAGEDRMGLQERHSISNGSVVGLLDPARDLGRRDRPQRRDRLRRTEREVEAGHRTLPEPPPQRGAGHRMTAVAEQVLHLLGGHHVAVLDTVDPDQAGADPAPRGLALRLVVVHQPGVAELGRVAAATCRVRYSYPDPAASFFNVIVTPIKAGTGSRVATPDSSVKEVCSEKEGGRKRGRGGEGEAG